MNISTLVEDYQFTVSLMNVSALNLQTEDFSQWNKDLGAFYGKVKYPLLQANVTFKSQQKNFYSVISGMPFKSGGTHVCGYRKKKKKGLNFNRELVSLNSLTGCKHKVPCELFRILGDGCGDYFSSWDLYIHHINFHFDSALLLPQLTDTTLLLGFLSFSGSFSQALHDSRWLWFWGGY